MQSDGRYQVEGDWQKSRLICKAPAPHDRPTLIVLDPFKIVREENPKARNAGYLTTGTLRCLFGKHALDVTPRSVTGEVAANAIVLFSYSDANREVADSVVRTQFRNEGWFVEHLESGPWSGVGGRNWHQGWIVSSGMNIPVLDGSIQEEWNRWVA